MRDKNKVKLVPSPTTSVSHQEVQGTKNDVDLDMDKITVTPYQRDNNINTNEPQEEMNAHLQQLLNAAEDRIATDAPSRPITRSQGTALSWNPVMNSSEVVVGNETV